jgi:hypothetical protein
MVLQAVFLGGTAIFHAMMRHALNISLNTSPALWTTTTKLHYSQPRPQILRRHKSDGIPPSEATSSTPKKFSAKKASFFRRIFDPGKFKSHQSVKSFFPE